MAVYASVDIPSRFRKFVGSVELDEHAAYIPALDELIEACGDKSFILKLNVDVRALGRWEAGSYWRQRTLQAFGSTPEEAVAKLWLQLQHTSASQPIFS
jgi:hypothetical protein